MQAWSSAQVPVVPGRGPELRLFDTSDRQVRPVAPGSKATMYVCGITPYDATHLGHAATYLAFDLVHRQWLDLGHDVHYVQNVTDIDDPLLERAERDGVDWRELGDGEVELFREDMATLRILPPREYVGATEAIPEVVELVEKMLASGAAYVLDGEYPDVYYRADATPQFGYESGYDRDTMLRLFAERGGDPRRPGKSDELDALLWRAARPATAGRRARRSCRVGAGRRRARQKAAAWCRGHNRTRSRTAAWRPRGSRRPGIRRRGHTRPPTPAFSRRVRPLRESPRSPRRTRAAAVSAASPCPPGKARPRRRPAPASRRRRARRAPARDRRCR